MTARELFLAVLGYQEFDRVPVVHWDVWPETRQRWLDEGLPVDADVAGFLGAVPRWVFVGARLVGLHPPFPEQVVEQTAQSRVVRGADGVVRREWLERSGLPHSLEFTLKSARDWPAYRERLQPDPDRIPADLDAELERAVASDLPVALSLTSLMGWVRDWMGLEGWAYLVHDDPGVYAEMVDTLATLACWSIDEVVARSPRVLDLAVCWEDVCGRDGPLISPPRFRELVAPGYRRIRDRLEEHGIGYLGVDCDGRIEPLLGSWLEAGVNLHYPVEIGTWEADPAALRRRFGRELRMLGGFDKRVLAEGPEAIDRELARRLPLVWEGGYVVMPDHHVPPETPLASYRHYLERIRELRRPPRR